jgi:hypothetical protein
MAAALIPRFNNESTWSFINAMSGVNTTQVPFKAIAGT